MAAALFLEPVQWSSQYVVLLVLPLCAALAVVYKTVRTESLRRLPLEILGAMGYLLAGILVLAGGLWAIQALLV